MTRGLPANLDRGLHSTAGRKADDCSIRRQIPHLPEASPVPAALWISEKEDARGKRSTALNKRWPPVGIGDRYDLKALKRLPEQGGGRGRLRPQDRVHHHSEEAPHERGLYAIRGDERDPNAHAWFTPGAQRLLNGTGTACSLSASRDVAGS